MTTQYKYEIIDIYIQDWLSKLDEKTKIGVFACLKMLAIQGPNLRRPQVGKIVNSKYKNMKELRPGSSGRSEVRILFIFDPRRRAVLLLAGDKATGSNKWKQWYNKNIPLAEEIYETHLQKEGLL